MSGLRYDPYWRVVRFRRQQERLYRKRVFALFFGSLVFVDIVLAMTFIVEWWGGQ